MTQVIILTIFFLINILIAIIWINLFDYIFKLNFYKIKIITLTIIIGFISSSTILSIPYLGNDTFNFTNKELLNHNITIFLWLFLSSIVFFFNLLLNKLNGFKNKYFWEIFIIFSIIFNIIGFILINFIKNENLKYFGFVAISEEFIKFMLALIIFLKYKIIKNDILIFSILSAIGFAFIENIVYLLYFLKDPSGKNILIGSIGLILTRGLFGFLVHIIFTGNIGLFHVRGFIKNLLLIFSPLGILVGISMHFGYNISIVNNLIRIFLIVLFFGYFWISWLFYNSDRIYIDYKSNY